MTQYDVNLRDYFRILRRRRGLVIIVPLLFGGFSLALALLQAPKPIYRATAVVRVERAMSFTGLLQELITFDPVGNLETQAALIKGFPVVSRAAQALGLIPRGATPGEIRTSPVYVKAVQDLQEQVGVKRVADTSLIEISATSPDPDAAVRIANSLAGAFQEDNLLTRSRQVRDAKEFIDQQLQEVSTKLRHSEEELKTFQQTNKILLLPEETRGVLGRLASLEADHAVVRRVMGETEMQLRFLDERRASGSPINLSPNGADPALSKLYASLSELALERDNLLLTVLPAHPQVKQLDAQIANVRQRLGEALTTRLQALRGQGAELLGSIARMKQEQGAVPETALAVARMEREVKISERIFSLLKEKHQEARIKEREQVGEVSLVRPAVGPLRPINSAQPLPKAAVGLVIGLIVGFVLAFVIEALDTSIGAIDEVESLLETSVLGVIPHFDLKEELPAQEDGAVVLDKESEKRHAFLIGLFLPGSRPAEAFRGLRTNLLFSGLDRDSKTIMVTSSTQMEGKTTVAINLAIALVQLGKRTLLVEADLRNPFLHHAFGIPKDPGFTEVLVGSATLEEAIRSFPDFVLGAAGVESLIDRRGIENLFLLPSGHQPRNPTEFLSAEKVGTFLDEMRQRYDFIVVDCAPILPVADPVILSSRVDGTLLVVRVGSVARAALRRAKVLLEGARARVLGVCLTGVKAEVSPDYAEMAYYRYRYGHRKERVAPSQAWSDWLGGAIGRIFKRAAVLLLPLLAAAIGIWALRAGHLDLPLLAAPRVNPVRVVHSVDQVPVRPEPRNADRALPTEAPPEPSAPENREPPQNPEKPGAPEELTYAIQLHAFRTEGKAQRVVAGYQARGLPAFSQARATEGGRWRRVFLGPFKNHDEAEIFALDLVLGGKIEEFLVVKSPPSP